MSKPYQVTREQLTDQQWADLCRFFELSQSLKRKVMERRAALAQKT